jgi:hypothetical protein
MSQSLTFRKHAIHCIRVAPTLPESERPVMLRMAQHWLRLAQIVAQDTDETSQPVTFH